MRLFSRHHRTPPPAQPVRLDVGGDRLVAQVIVAALRDACVLVSDVFGDDGGTDPGGAVRQGLWVLVAADDAEAAAAILRKGGLHP
jgi:hypothetical protein